MLMRPADLTHVVLRTYGESPVERHSFGTGLPASDLVESLNCVCHSILTLTPLEAFFWPPGYPLLVALASLTIGQVPLAGQAVSTRARGL